MAIFGRKIKKEQEPEKTEEQLTIIEEDVEIMPVISEKTRKLAEKNIFTFKIRPPKLNRSEIKRIIEKTFNVKVEEVRTINYPQRKRGITRIPSVRFSIKKAYVKLQKGYKIPIFE